MDTLIIFGGAALIVIVGLFLVRKPVTMDEYYSDGDPLPPTPQPWGVDMYQPWPQGWRGHLTAPERRHLVGRGYTVRRIGHEWEVTDER